MRYSPHAACCGIFGMRLASETWPITHMFPRVPSGMTWLCGQGPLTSTLPQMRAVLEVAAPALRKDSGRPSFRAEGAVLYVPSSGGHWPNFARDVTSHVARAIGPVGDDHGLPSTRRVHWIYNGIWCSHFDELLEADPSLTFWNGLSAVLLAVVFRGLVDKRIHPGTAALLLQIALGRALLFHNKQRALDDAKAIKRAFERIWECKRLVVMPVCGWPAPRLGRTNWNPRIVEFTAPANLADAVGLALPFGTFADKLPRALQLLGPPGSELELIELGERLMGSA